MQAIDPVMFLHSAMVFLLFIGVVSPVPSFAGSDDRRASSGRLTLEGFTGFSGSPYMFDYMYFKGTGNAALLYVNPEYAPDGWPEAGSRSEITWETGEVPGDRVGGAVTFAWAIGISGADNSLIKSYNGVLPEMGLYLDAGAEPLVCFNPGVPGDTVWTGAVAGVRLEFEAVARDEWDDLSGIMRLTLPGGLLVPGRPARLSVRAMNRPGVKAYYMVFEDRAVASYENPMPGAAGRFDGWRKYHEPHPLLAGYDAGAHLHIRSCEQADTVRRSIIEYFWPVGGFPAGKMPESVALLRPRAGGSRDERWWRRPGEPDPGGAGTPGQTLAFVKLDLLAGVEWLETEVDFGYRHGAALLHPVRPAPVPRLLIMHQGHGMSFAREDEGIYETTHLALEHGFTVLMMHMPLVGWNTNRVFTLPGGEKVVVKESNTVGHNRMVPALEGHGRGSALRFFIEPVITGINYFLAMHGEGSDIAMAGLSGGGWTTHVAAAVDKRIRVSVAVAGSYPLYIRRLYPGAAGDAEQEWPPLFVERASWLDIYALAGYGGGRLAIQVLNRYDPYFYGAASESYAGLVSDTVKDLGGEWRCVMDDTHKRHIISKWAIREVIAPALGIGQE